MDTPDRFDGPPPSWTPAPLPAGGPIRPAWDDPGDPAAAPGGRKLSLRLVGRALRRHWWQALALWAVASAGLMALAYHRIRPTFESMAWLEVDPSKQALLGPASRSGGEAGSSLETQVALVTSPEVLNMAIHDPKVAALPRIARSLDPETELREAVLVAIQPKTNLILISMTSESPGEPPTVVNAVVDAYLKASESWTDHETREQTDRLKQMKKAFETEQADQRRRLKKLAEGDVDPANAIAANQYASHMARLSGVVLERMAAESRLETYEEFYKRTRHGHAARTGPPQGAALDAAVKRAFWADPEVADLVEQMAAVRDRLDRASEIARKPGDLAVQGLRARYDKLERRYHQLWERREPTYRERVLAGTLEEKSPEAARIDEAKVELETLRKHEESIRDAVKALEGETKAEGGKALERQFAEADLKYTDVVLEAINKNLQQLDYESRQGTKITVISRAKPTLRPQGSKKLVIMAAAPVLVLAAVLALFVLIEAASARVADPDDLPARVRVGVIGVVPPLPSLSATRGPRALRDERRRVEEFVQSLDHLRVVLCAGAPGAAPGRRCVLITSACGGEGKTTLAAQLAGRCANAGLLTLLVDADLRRPSLGELLEVPEGPGLADVLQGEAEPEAAMVVIGNAGGFHLLPAGTPGHDPARLLQGDRLGQLLAQFRATFDVVIVDAPPVLAVPDALLLGRWTDGAVLAVRHDTSRYPLVERANRRLASIGIPVLGAVVNGVRTVENSYGAYYHYQHSSAGRGDDPAPA